MINVTYYMPKCTSVYPFVSLFYTSLSVSISVSLSILSFNWCNDQVENVGGI